MLCWVTFAKVLDRVGSLRDMGWCCLACAAVIAVNVTRISLIALYPGSYDLIHGPIGYTVGDWITVGVIVGTCLLGFRRALPAGAYATSPSSEPLGSETQAGCTAKQDSPGRLSPSRLGLIGLAALVLAVSLPPKLAIAVKIYAGPALRLNLDEIAAALNRHGFEVTEREDFGSPPWVSAVAGRCGVMVAEVDPQGWHRSLVGQIATGQRLLYTFKGQTYPEQPVMRTRIHYFWTLLKRKLGLPAAPRPVLAIVASFEYRDTPLQDLAKLGS